MTFPFSCSSWWALSANGPSNCKPTGCPMPVWSARWIRSSFCVCCPAKEVRPGLFSSTSMLCMREFFWRSCRRAVPPRRGLSGRGRTWKAARVTQPCASATFWPALNAVTSFGAWPRAAFRSSARTAGLPRSRWRMLLQLRSQTRSAGCALKCWGPLAEEPGSVDLGQSVFRFGVGCSADVLFVTCISFCCFVCYVITLSLCSKEFHAFCSELSYLKNRFSSIYCFQKCMMQDG